jgi:putative acetyltransferase
MEIRKYKTGEEKAIWELFYNTIQNVNTQHYNQDQVNAWAPKDIDLNIAAKKIQSIDPYVVILDGQIVAYADIQANGYIDHFFCHKDYQRKGIGVHLFKRLKQVAIEAGVNQLSADVSITARPFFESIGFTVEKEQFLNHRGQELVNYKMLRPLDHS